MRMMPTFGEVSFQPACEYPRYPLAEKVCFVSPDHFRVEQAINPHMVSQEGRLNTVDPGKARKQWEALVDVYRSLGFKTAVWDSSVHCPDMVFCANQSLPFISQSDGPAALLSHMHSDLRHEEVSLINKAFVRMGIKTHKLSQSRSSVNTFEGTGDALWVPGRQLLLGGYGFRTHMNVYKEVSKTIDAPVVLFELLDPRFYHLDTALSIIDDRTVLACEEAFTSEGWNDLHYLFDRVLKVPLFEADSPGFACNAHSPDQKHVIIQKGNRHTELMLEQLGYSVVSVDTSEFIKSGGSVFCLKLMVF